MSKTRLLRFDLAQLRLLHSILERHEESGAYWGNREHHRNRLLRIVLEVNGAIAMLETEDAA